MSNSKSPHPVTAEELDQVRNILERMQGLFPGNSTMNALAAFSQSPLQVSRMTVANASVKTPVEAILAAPSLI